MVVCATLRPGASPGLGVQGGHPPCRGGVGGEEPPARPVTLRALWTTCDTTRDAQWSEGSQGGAPPCGMPKGKALGCNVLRCIDHPHAKHDGWRGELASRSGQSTVMDVVVPCVLWPPCGRKDGAPEGLPHAQRGWQPPSSSEVLAHASAWWLGNASLRASTLGVSHRQLAAVLAPPEGAPSAP